MISRFYHTLTSRQETKLLEKLLEKLPETIQFKIEPNLTTQFSGVKMDVFRSKLTHFNMSVFGDNFEPFLATGHTGT